MSEVTAGTARKLANLPNTITDRMNQLYRDRRALFNRIDSDESLHRFAPGDVVPVYGLAWTASDDGVVFAQKLPWDEEARVHRTEVTFVPTNGEVSTVATIEMPFPPTIPLERIKIFADCRNVLAWNHSPLIWDAVGNKPRVTPFDYLLPSSTSGRFLGIEIDTRQLVLVGEDLQISQRFDFRLSPKRDVEMQWSADERYVALRHQSIADDVQMFRMDLRSDTAQRLPSMSQLAFTGRHDELVNIVTPVWGREDVVVTIVPAGDPRPFELFRLTIPEMKPHKPYPRVVHNSGGSLFVMGFPRGKQVGFHIHLVDRGRQRWPIGEDDPRRYYAPFHVITFANNDQTLVACDDLQLFSLPVASIIQQSESGDE